MENYNRISDTIECPYCGTPSTGSFATVEEQDDTGPKKVLYKCSKCGRFYATVRVITWRVIKG